jgi:hypothetical protein
MLPDALPLASCRARMRRAPPRPSRQMSTEASVSSPSSLLDSAPCSQCGAPGAADQRYCLECGARRIEARSQYLDGLSAPSPANTSAPPRPRSSDGSRRAGASLNVIAGVGVLLLAMGVGVLIGRSGSATTATAPPQIVSISSGAGTGAEAGTTAGATPSPAVAFNDSWPSGKDGYTVQLQTLPVAGTQVSEVSAAESAAGTKGASDVGALQSDDHQGLPSGLYILYSGVYASAAQAKHALAGLTKRFPAAKVIHVGRAAGTNAAAKATQSPTATSAPGTASTPASTAPSSPGSGQSNEQKSRNEPDVVSTG